MKLPRIGETFRDRYYVEELLGEGSFGAVFAATDTAASRKVALKILKPDAGESYDPKTKARFEREIRTVANLRNPHTVSLFDCGETEDGLLFVVFEHVPGEDLSEHLERVGRISADATVHIARQVLQSLREAHDAGLLHRDVKPHNIRVFEYQGDPLTVKLLDFGLARGAGGGGPEVTEQGEIIGTPRYMAPEQLMDQQIGPAADVYSLGMVMLEMLLGSDALSGSRFGDQLERLRAGHVFSLGELEQSGLAPIIKRMTAREPRDRFTDAGAALTALDRRGSDAITARVHPAETETPTAPIDPMSTPVTSSSTSTPTTPVTPPPSSSGVSTNAATASSMSSSVLIGVVAVLLSLIVLAAVSADKLADDEPPVAPPNPPAARTDSPLIVSDEPSEPAEKPAPVDEASDASDPVDELSGCDREPPFKGVGKLRQEDVLDTHQWLAHIPREYDPQTRAPLVVLLHPTGQSPEQLLHFSRFGDVADEHGFVVIAPHDTHTLSWRDGPSKIAFVHQRVQQTIEKLCIDDRRVFVVTQGHGGFVAEEAMCEPWVTAVATNAWRLDKGALFCDMSIPKPYLLLSPTRGQDPFEGGANCAGGLKMSVADVEAMWRERNGCGNARERTFRYKGSTCFRWECETPFESCHVEGGHNWPGSPQRQLDVFVNCDGESPDFPMAERVWEFFTRVEPLRGR